MSLCRDWLTSHAIDLPLAASIGLHRKGNEEVLYAPYERADGSTFERYRKFPDGKWMQPKGEELALWWPLGRAHGASVLLCEGEGDTLAAASVLDKATEPWLNGLCPVGLPGVGMPAERAAAELACAGTKRVYFALDNDEAGERATKKLIAACSAAGVRTSQVHFEDKDLSEELAGANKPNELLADLVENAEVIQWEPEPPKPKATGVYPVTELDRIPPADYIERLTGSVTERGWTTCPLPDHDDANPSCQVWEDPDRGWYCRSCDRGGDLYTLAAFLWDLPTHGEGFKDLRRRLEDTFSLTKTQESDGGGEK